MKRRISILTLICCSLLCTIVGVSEVWATSGSVSGGFTNVLQSSGGGGGGASFSTTTIAFGYRVTIIEQNGTIAKNTAGEKTHSFDYWSSWESDTPAQKKGYQYLIDKENRGWVGQRTIRYYSEKNPKTVKNPIWILNLFPVRRAIPQSGLFP